MITLDVERRQSFAARLVARWFGLTVVEFVEVVGIAFLVVATLATVALASCGLAYLLATR